MSYVFSKALQPKEETEQKKTDAHKRRVPAPVNVPQPVNAQNKVPPPVARKPSAGNAPQQLQGKSNPPVRRVSLPARAQSFDVDYGTGPKMGGKIFHSSGVLVSI